MKHASLELSKINEVVLWKILGGIDTRNHQSTSPLPITDPEGEITEEEDASANNANG